MPNEETSQIKGEGTFCNLSFGLHADLNPGNDQSIVMDKSGSVLKISKSLSDILAIDLDVVFCGINPALSAAQSGHHFSNPTNRFWRVLHLAGFTPHLIRAADDRRILEFACGLTAAIQRPTARASEVTKDEFRRGAKVLERTIHQYHPRYLAFLGKPAFATIFNQPNVAWGSQSVVFAGARVWVLPNPSGLNRAFDLQALVNAYRELWDELQLEH